MENVATVAEPKTKGEKIRAALTGKKWSPERRAAFKKTIDEGRKLWDLNQIDPTTGKRKGFRIGRPAKDEVSQ